MPSVSKKQHNFMAAVAKNPAFAKKVGVPSNVGKDFLNADKNRKFAQGGDMKESKAMVAKEMAFMKKKGAPKSMIKHEMAEAGMKKGTKKMADGGMPVEAMPVRAMPARANMSGASRGLGRAGAMSGRMMPGRVTTMAKGGLTAGHKSADGIAKKGKTDTAMIKMAKGGRSC